MSHSAYLCIALLSVTLPVLHEDRLLLRLLRLLQLRLRDLRLFALCRHNRHRFFSLGPAFRLCSLPKKVCRKLVVTCGDKGPWITSTRSWKHGKSCDKASLLRMCLSFCLSASSQNVAVQMQVKLLQTNPQTLWWFAATRHTFRH